MRGRGKKWVKVGVGVCVTGLALWLSFRKIDWQVLRASFTQVRWLLVAAATFNVIFILYALGWRWQLLLKPKAHISMGRLFKLNIISQYTNIIMPVRLGEAARVYLLAKNENVPGGFATGTVVVEKLMDFFMFVAFWILVPVLFATELEIQGAGMPLFLCVLAASFLVLLVWKPSIFLKAFAKLSKVVPGKAREKLTEFFSSGMEALEALKHRKTFTVIVLLSVVFVGGQALTIYLLFLAFGLELSFWAALVVMLAIQVGNIPPSTPGKIGVHEYATILALSVFGIAKTEALSYAIMLHVVAYLPKIILGAIVMPGLRIKGLRGKD